MKEFDLETMSLDQLRELRGQIDRAIASFTDRKRREAIAAAEEAVRAHGFTNLAELTRRGGRGARSAASGRAPGAKPSSEARYANPQDASQTWSGRGRRPAWVNEALGSGRSLDDLAV